VSACEKRSVLGEGAADAKLAKFVAPERAHVTILCNDQGEPQAQRQCHGIHATMYQLCSYLYVLRVCPHVQWH